MKKIIITLFITIWLLSIFYYENRNLIMSNKINNIGIKAYNNELHDIWIGQFNFANNIKQDAIILYNIWNTYYKTAEEKNDENEKIAYYELALDSYSWSLNLEYNQDTQDNYEYVEQKLDKLLNPEQEEQDTQSEEENSKSNQQWEKQEAEESNSEAVEGQEWNKTEDTKEWTNSEEWTKSEEGDWDENSSWNNWEEWSWEWEWNNRKENLTQEQLKQIEKYSEDLKETEFYNQKYFNKTDINEWNDKSYEELLDIIERGWEKDW